MKKGVRRSGDASKMLTTAAAKQKPGTGRDEENRPHCMYQGREEAVVGSVSMVLGLRHYFRIARHRGVDSARSPKQLNVRLAERRGIATSRQGIPIAERETSWWESRECEVKYGRVRRPVQSRSNQGTSATADRRERDAPFVSSNRGIAAADLEMPNSNPKDKAQQRKRPVYCQKNAKTIVQTRFGYTNVCCPTISGLCFSPNRGCDGTLVEFQMPEPAATFIRE